MISKSGSTHDFKRQVMRASDLQLPIVALLGSLSLGNDPPSLLQNMHWLTTADWNVFLTSANACSAGGWGGHL